LGLNRESLRRTALTAALALLGACAPNAVTAPIPMAPGPTPVAGLPEVPRANGPLVIQVAYPHTGDTRPKVDSTFIFGTVGTGAAELTIDGARVPVAPNGAFLTYLPLPANGVWELEARAHGETVRQTVAYRTPPPAAPAAPTTPPAPAPPAAPATVRFPQPLVGTVRGVSDTLATGSDVAPAYPVPNTNVDRRWLFPAGTQLTVVATQGGMVEAQLDGSASAWLDTSLVALGAPATPAAPPGAISVTPAAGWVDVRVPVGGTPFLITSDGPTLSVSLYGLPRPLTSPTLTGDSLLAGAAWRADSAGTTTLDLRLTRPVWGYKAFYEPDGTLVLRVRRPPHIDPDHPLQGIRVAVDAGHPPGGAIGPTGLTEAEANMMIAQRLFEKLRAAGAVLIPIRTTLAPLVSATNTSAELSARVEKAVSSDADMLISIHNNAFGEGVNPFLNEGTSTLYFHPQSRDLAAALDRQIVAVTHIPDLGALFQNIAIGRITWMPSVITESLFMMFPQQEYALRDPAMQDRLAEAHLRGIEDFLRSRR
jgi:N-acetylmuramoyl-L-alanine amidase